MPPLFPVRGETTGRNFVIVSFFAACHHIDREVGIITSLCQIVGEGKGWAGSFLPANARWSMKLPFYDQIVHVAGGMQAL